MTMNEKRKLMPLQGSNLQTALFLVLIASLVLFWLAAPQVFIPSDPWAYSSHAFQILSKGDFGENHVFSHRLMVTLPVAGIYSLLGVSIHSTNLWPLFAAMLIAWVIWQSLPTLQSKVIGGLIWITSIPILSSVGALLPDIVAAAFMGLSTVALANRFSYEPSSWRFNLNIVAAASTLCFAFLAKESAYWVVPVWLLTFYRDCSPPTRESARGKFYGPTLLILIIAGFFYMIFCRHAWGSYLARLEAIQSLSSIHYQLWDAGSLWTMVKRLTVSPLKMLIITYKMPLLLAIIGIFTIKKSPSALIWKQYTITCLLFYWFGSTSLTRYIPMPLAERMTLPALPGMYILAALLLSDIIDRLKHEKLRLFLLILTASALAIQPLAGFIRNLSTIDQSEAIAMSILRASIERNDQQQQNLLLTSDPRSPQSLSFYFSYKYPTNLTVAYPSELPNVDPSVGKIYFYVNRGMSDFLERSYGQKNYNKSIEKLHLKSLYHSGNISLYEGTKNNSTAFLSEAAAGR